jgi:hypothetical protein
LGIFLSIRSSQIPLWPTEMVSELETELFFNMASSAHLSISG